MGMAMCELSAFQWTGKEGCVLTYHDKLFGHKGLKEADEKGQRQE